MIRFVPPFKTRYIASVSGGVAGNIARVGVSVLTTCAAIVTHEGSATVSTSIGVSASGQQTDQQHYGTATVGVVISSTASASVTSTHSGTATASIVITTTAAGETGAIHSGTANIGVTISASSSGTVVSPVEGTANIGVTITTTASGTASQTHAGVASCQVNLSASAAANVANYLYESDVLSISNNLLWLRADDIDGDEDKTDNPSDNTSISSWASRNNGLTVSCTSGLEPTFQTNENGTLPAVKFDSTDELYVDWDSSMTNYTVFLVVKNYDSAASGGYIMDGGQASSSRLGWLDRATGNFRMGGVANFTEVLSESGQSADTDWHIITAHYNGANSSLRVDLSAADSGDIGASNGTYAASEGIVIGGANHSNLYGSKILVAEVLAYSGGLSTSDRDKVEGYLNDKWSITITHSGTATCSVSVTTSASATVPTTHSGTASCQVNLSASASASVSTPYSNNNSLLFDGSNDYLDIGSMSALASASSFSVSFWFKNNGNSTGNVFGGWGSSLHNNIGCNPSYSTNTFYFVVRAGSAVGALSVSSLTSYAQSNTWNHFVCTFDGGDRKIFINGTQRASDTGVAPSTTSSSAGDNVAIGRRETYYAKGRIDEVALYSSALSQSEVTDIYNSGTPDDRSNDSNLLGYWRMEEGSGTTVADSSGNGNTATLTNGPTFSTDKP